MSIYSIRSHFDPQRGNFNRQNKTHTENFSDTLANVRNTFSEAKGKSDVYVVQSGDSLYRIAARLKTSLALPQSVTKLVKEMSSLNHLSNPDRIFPGQQLRLPATIKAKTTLDFSQTKPTNGNATLVNQHVSALQTQVETFTPPGTLINPAGDFPLFTLNGRIILPSEITASSLTRQDFPISVSTPSDEKNGQTTAAANDPVELQAVSPAETETSPKRNHSTQVAMYVEDQLLAHPGGDYYFLNRDHDIHDPSFDQGNFINRVGKDLADSGRNLLNIAKNLALGAEYKYVSENGDIRSGQQLGFLGTLGNFVEDVFSGLSFGAYVPDGEKTPQGVWPSVGHFFRKLLYDAPVRDLLIGIPHAAVNIVKDAALASLNLLEVIPDATVGNFEWGQKLTTTVFDNGQVVVDYLTDILPGGDAWLRVHAAGPRGDIELPVYFNLMTSEQGIFDSRWATVRNTHFRKTIETLGSLLSDAAVVALTAHSYSPSSDQRHD